MALREHLKLSLMRVDELTSGFERGSRRRYSMHGSRRGLRNMSKGGLGHEIAPKAQIKSKFCCANVKTSLIFDWRVGL